MKYNLEKESTPSKTCLCGRDFRVPWSFVVIQSPLLTIVGVCSDCSRKLRYGSFAERISTASQLARKATRMEVA